ncbi:MAG: hypothetical protein LBF12_05740 [Christensenellaceae bacterium]|jgi:predicted amidophosphoribosyltransferase|nr:hypothetical protein [Christensenellaceae bacterium]
METFKSPPSKFVLNTKIFLTKLRKAIVRNVVRATKEVDKAIYADSLVCFNCGNELRTENEFYTTLCGACSNHLPARRGRHCKYCGAYTIESDEKVCPDCRLTPPEFERVIAPFENKGVVKQMLHDYKKSGFKYLYLYIARFITDHFLTAGYYADYVVYMPSTKRQRFITGFNSLKKIADYFSKRTGIPQIYPVYRSKNIPEYMAGTDRATRYESLYGVFSINPEFSIDVLQDKTIILLNDHMNTGATENACARVLKENGAANVIIVAFARS